jgi:ribulose-5-phosphate 4-epimerase/fuculose-1-phosphate aldolase
VLHAHSPFAVSLACLRRDIPPFHYMIARFGGDTIRCADYAIFGSPELSTAAMHAMAGRKGCLLANHGLLVAGRDLDEALALAVELEELCEQYWRACQLGEPVLLTAAEMGRCWKNSPATGSRRPFARRSKLRTRASSSRILHGLGKKSSAPISMPIMRSISSERVE